MSTRSLKLSVASPESIKSWTEHMLPNGKKVGKIFRNDFLDYKENFPVRGGLNCERIFGPVISFNCTCGRLAFMRNSNSDKNLYTFSDNKTSFRKSPTHNHKEESDEEVFPYVSPTARQNTLFSNSTLISPILNSTNTKLDPNYQEFDYHQYKFYIFKSKVFSSQGLYYNDFLNACALEEFLSMNKQENKMVSDSSDLSSKKKPNLFDGNGSKSGNGSGKESSSLRAQKAQGLEADASWSNKENHYFYNPIKSFTINRQLKFPVSPDIKRDKFRTLLLPKTKKKTKIKKNKNIKTNNKVLTLLESKAISKQNFFLPNLKSNYNNKLTFLKWYQLVVFTFLFFNRTITPTIFLLFRSFPPFFSAEISSSFYFPFTRFAVSRKREKRVPLSFISSASHFSSLKKKETRENIGRGRKEKKDKKKRAQVGRYEKNLGELKTDKQGKTFFDYQLTQILSLAEFFTQSYDKIFYKSAVLTRDYFKKHAPNRFYFQSFYKKTPQSSFNIQTHLNKSSFNLANWLTLGSFVFIKKSGVLNKLFIFRKQGNNLLKRLQVDKPVIINKPQKTVYNFFEKEFETEIQKNINNFAKNEATKNEKLKKNKSDNRSSTSSFQTEKEKQEKTQTISGPVKRHELINAAMETILSKIPSPLETDYYPQEVTYCPNCEVEMTAQNIRRYRLGYIELTAPMAHLWYVSRSIPWILNLSKTIIQGIAECYYCLTSGMPNILGVYEGGSEHHEHQYLYWYQYDNFNIPLTIHFPSTNFLLSDPKSYALASLFWFYISCSNEKKSLSGVSIRDAGAVSRFSSHSFPKTLQRSTQGKKRWHEKKSNWQPWQEKKTMKNVKKEFGNQKYYLKKKTLFESGLDKPKNEKNFFHFSDWFKTFSPLEEKKTEISQNLFTIPSTISYLPKLYTKNVILFKDLDFKLYIKDLPIDDMLNLSKNLFRPKIMLNKRNYNRPNYNEKKLQSNTRFFPVSFLAKDKKNQNLKHPKVYFYNFKIRSLLSLFIFKWMYKIEILKANLLSNSFWFKIIQYSKHFLLTNLKNKLQPLKKSPWLIQKEKELDFFYSLAEKKNIQKNSLAGDLPLNLFKYNIQQAAKKKNFQMIFIQNLNNFLGEKNFLVKLAYENLLSSKYISLVSRFDSYHIKKNDQIVQNSAEPEKLNINDINPGKLLINHYLFYYFYYYQVEQIRNYGTFLLKTLFYRNTFQTYMLPLNKKQKNNLMEFELINYLVPFLDKEKLKDLNVSRADDYFKGEKFENTDPENSFFIRREHPSYKKRIFRKNKPWQSSNDFFFPYYRFSIHKQGKYKTAFALHFFESSLFCSLFFFSLFKIRGRKRAKLFKNNLLDQLPKKTSTISSKRHLSVFYRFISFPPTFFLDNPIAFNVLKKKENNFKIHSHFPAIKNEAAFLKSHLNFPASPKNLNDEPRRAKRSESVLFPGQMAIASNSNDAKNKDIEQSKVNITANKNIFIFQYLAYLFNHMNPYTYVSTYLFSSSKLSFPDYLTTHNKKTNVANNKKRSLKGLFLRDAGTVSRFVLQNPLSHATREKKRPSEIPKREYSSRKILLRSFSSEGRRIEGTDEIRRGKNLANISQALPVAKKKHKMSFLDNQRTRNLTTNVGMKNKRKFGNRQAALSIEFLGFFKSFLKRKFFIHDSALQNKELSFFEVPIFEKNRKELSNKDRTVFIKNSSFNKKSFSSLVAFESSLYAAQQARKKNLAERQITKTINKPNFLKQTFLQSEATDEWILKKNNSKSVINKIIPLPLNDDTKIKKTPYLKKILNKHELKKEQKIQNKEKHWKNSSLTTPQRGFQNVDKKSIPNFSEDGSKQKKGSPAVYDVDQTNYKNKNYYGCISQLNNWATENDAFTFFTMYLRPKFFLGDFLLPYAEKRQFFEVMPRTGGIILEYLLGAIESCFFFKNIDNTNKPEVNQKFREPRINPMSFQFLFMSQVFFPFQNSTKFFYDYKKFTRPSICFQKQKAFKTKTPWQDFSLQLSLFKNFSKQGSQRAGSTFNKIFLPSCRVFEPSSLKGSRARGPNRIFPRVLTKKKEISTFLGIKTESFNLYKNSFGENSFFFDKKKRVQNWKLKKKWRKIGIFKKEKKILQFQKKIFETTERISSIKFEKPFYWYQLNHFFSYTDIRVLKFIYSLIISCKRKTFATSWKTIGNPMQSFLLSGDDLKDSFVQKKMVDLSTFQTTPEISFLNYSPNEINPFLFLYWSIIISIHEDQAATPYNETAENTIIMVEFFKKQAHWTNRRSPTTIFSKNEEKNFLKKTTILNIYYQISSFNFNLISSYFPTKTVLLICSFLIKLFVILPVTNISNSFFLPFSSFLYSRTNLKINAFLTKQQTFKNKIKDSWHKTKIGNKLQKWNFYFSSSTYNLNSSNNLQDTTFSVNREFNFNEKIKIYNIFISDFSSIHWKNNTNENMAFLPSLNFPSWSASQNIFSSWSNQELFFPTSYPLDGSVTAAYLKSRLFPWPNLKKLEKEKILVSNLFEKKTNSTSLSFPYQLESKENSLKKKQFSNVFNWNNGWNNNKLWQNNIRSSAASHRFAPRGASFLFPGETSFFSAPKERGKAKRDKKIKNLFIAGKLKGLKNFSNSFSSAKKFDFFARTINYKTKYINFLEGENVLMKFKEIGNYVKQLKKKNTVFKTVILKMDNLLQPLTISEYYFQKACFSDQFEPSLGHRSYNDVISNKKYIKEKARIEKILNFFSSWSLINIKLSKNSKLSLFSIGTTTFSPYWLFSKFLKGSLFSLPFFYSRYSFSSKFEMVNHNQKHAKRVKHLKTLQKFTIDKIIKCFRLPSSLSSKYQYPLSSQLASSSRLQAQKAQGLEDQLKKKPARQLPCFEREKQEEMPIATFFEFYQSRKNFLHKKIFKPFLQQSMTRLCFFPPFFLHFSYIKNFFSYIDFDNDKVNKNVLIRMLQEYINKKNALLDFKHRKKIKRNFFLSSTSLPKDSFLKQEIFYNPLLLKNVKPKIKRKIRKKFMKAHSKVLNNFIIHFTFRKKVNILMRNSKRKKHLHFLQTFRQLRFFEYFRTNFIKPKWMIIRILPVLPPDLRPIITVANGYISSDLNTLYQKVMYQNNNVIKNLELFYIGPYLMYNIKNNLSKMPIDSSFLSFYKFSPSINFIREKSWPENSKKLNFFLNEEFLNKTRQPESESLKDLDSESKKDLDSKSKKDFDFESKKDLDSESKKDLDPEPRIDIIADPKNYFLKRRQKKKIQSKIDNQQLVTADQSKKKKIFPKLLKNDFTQIALKTNFNKNLFHFLKTFIYSRFNPSINVRDFFKTVSPRVTWRNKQRKRIKIPGTHSRSKIFATYFFSSKWFFVIFPFSFPFKDLLLQQETDLSLIYKQNKKKLNQSNSWFHFKSPEGWGCFQHRKAVSCSDFFSFSFQGTKTGKNVFFPSSYHMFNLLNTRSFGALLEWEKKPKYNYNQKEQLQWCSPQKENIISSKIFTPYEFTRCLDSSVIRQHYISIRSSKDQDIQYENASEANFSYPSWFNKHKIFSDFKNKFSRFIYSKKSMIYYIYRFPLLFKKFDDNTTFRLKQLRIQAIHIFDSVQEQQYAMQKTVNILIDNNQQLQSNTLFKKEKRLLTSLSEQLRGKQGRFRQNLLGKRVDYSGRSVIIVGPNLKLYECGIPIVMALKLFQPFLLLSLINQFEIPNGLAFQLIQKKHPIALEILNKLLETWPVLLNRAPTLHRMNIQAFKIRLVKGKCILLHPLVCSSFNADFDGDQMGVHIPLTQHARAEAWKLLWSVNNSINLASRQPLFLPSQDLVIGNYYLTKNPFPQYILPLSWSLENKEELSFKSPFLDQKNLAVNHQQSQLLTLLEPFYQKKFPIFNNIEEAYKYYCLNPMNNGHINSPVWFYSFSLFETAEREKPIEFLIDQQGYNISISKYYEIHCKKNRFYVKTLINNVSTPRSNFGNLYKEKSPSSFLHSDDVGAVSRFLPNNEKNGDLFSGPFSPSFEKGLHFSPRSSFLLPFFLCAARKGIFFLSLLANKEKKHQGFIKKDFFFTNHKEETEHSEAQKNKVKKLNHKITRDFLDSSISPALLDPKRVARKIRQAKVRLKDVAILKKNIKNFRFKKKFKTCLYTFSYRLSLNFFAQDEKRKIKLIPNYQTFLYTHNQASFSWKKNHVLGPAFSKCFNFSLTIRMLNSPSFSLPFQSRKNTKNYSYMYYLNPISIKQILRSTFGRIEFYLNTFEIEDQ